MLLSIPYSVIGSAVVVLVGGLWYVGMILTMEERDRAKKRDKRKQLF